MSLWPYMNYNLQGSFYTMKDKLYQYSVTKSKQYFDKAQKVREDIKTPEDLQAYQKKMKTWFLDSMGGVPYDKNLPLDAEIKGVIEEDNLTIEKVIFKAREGVYVTANFYLPKHRQKPCPGILFQLGHSTEGKQYPVYQKAARILASYGLAVLAMDPVGQGERSGYAEHEIGRNMIPKACPDHQMGGDPCFLTGKQSIRYFVADGMKGVDYLLSRPEVDPERIGATGNSGGGTMTAVSAVCDDRIKAAAPGTFITNREEYIYAGSAQDSEQIWFGATKEGFDHYELLACVAPKPYMILVADSDFFPIEGTEKVYDFCKSFWKMLGKEENLQMAVDKTLHQYSTGLAYAAAEFFAKSFDVDTEKQDISLSPLPGSQLFCTSKGYVSFDYPDARFLHEENKLVYEEVVKQRDSIPQVQREERAREFIKSAMYEGREQLPLKLRTFDTEYDNGLKIQPLMWFSQPQVPNFGMIFTDFRNKELTGSAAILLNDRGTDALDDMIDRIRAICKSGGAAFVVDLSGIGKNAPFPLNTIRQEKDRYGAIDRITKDMFFCGDSLCALRLFEVECAQRVLKEHFPNAKIELYARGLSTVYAKLYQIVHPECDIETDGFSGKLSDVVTSRYYENYNLPSVLFPNILEYVDI